ncbi:MAG TPA: hypothetical protein VK858_08980 [Longimicrobiales bacterium]|nr:hypothetical protein [Longimicrobiales bacterium]
MRRLPLLFASVLLPACLSGQVLIPDEVACPGCTVEAEVAVRLGTPDGPGALLGPPLAVTEDARGRYWVTWSDDLPMVFSATGPFEAILGRAGEGPGEFVGPGRILPVPGDSVLIFDGALRRATVVDPQLSSVRTIRMPGSGSRGHVLRWPDSVLIAGSVATPEFAGRPLQFLDLSGSSGTVLSAFGDTSDAGDLRTLDQARLLRHVSIGNREGVWLSAVVDYDVFRWTPGSENLTWLSRRPEWFRTTSPWSLGSPDRPPPPFVQGLSQDEAGLLWVFTTVARPDWASAWPDVPAGVVEIPSIHGPSHFELYRSVLEVIDPRSRRVVTRAEFPNWLIVSPLPGRRAAFYVEDALGVPSILVVQLSLAGY